MSYAIVEIPLHVPSRQVLYMFSDNTYHTQSGKLNLISRVLGSQTACTITNKTN
jgi:hypothetical protein